MSYQKINNSTVSDDMNASQKLTSFSQSQLEKADTLIDFKAELKGYKDRTELNVPYTVMLTEDVMFLKQNKLVSLEYIIYQNSEDACYMQIKEKLKGSKNLLNPQNYLAKAGDTNRHFQKDPKCYYIAKENYLEGKELLKTSSRDAQVEAIISTWKITEESQMIKESEQKFHYNFDFMPSNQNQLKFQLSHDKKIVFLPIIKGCRHSPQSHDDQTAQKNVWARFYDKQIDIQVRAWKTNKKLDPIYLPQLEGKLKFKPEVGKTITIGVDDVQMVNKNNHLLVKVHQSCEGKKQDQDLIFYIFDMKTGEEVFKMNNKQCSQTYSKDDFNVQCNDDDKNPEPSLDLIDKSISCLDMLVENIIDDDCNMESEKDAEEDGDPSEEEAPNEEVEASDDDEELEEDDDAKEADKVKDEDEKEEVDNDVADNQEESGINKECGLDTLKLCFFYAAADPELPKDQWILAHKKISLDDLQKKGEDIESQIKYLKDEGIECLKEAYADKQRNMHLPANWFLQIVQKGQDKYVQSNQQWSGKVKITMNMYFNFIGALNGQKDRKMFMGFQKEELNGKECWQESFKEYILQKQEAKLTRNQQTKEYLIITKRDINGIKTYAFFGKDPNTWQTRSKELIFKNDHLESRTDCQIIGLNDMKLTGCYVNNKALLGDFEKCGLQTCSQTEGYQDVYLKTIHKVPDPAGGMMDLIESKQSISQFHQGTFPLMMYNCGQQKIVIQMFTRQCQTLIYDVPLKESFQYFVNFNTLEDLGFQCQGLKIEAASCIVFMTENRRTRRERVNILMIDPYYKNTQILLFKSTSSFCTRRNNKLKDQIIKAYMYENAANEIILIKQFRTFVEDFKIQETKDIAVEDQAESSSSDENNEDDEGGIQSKENLETVQMVSDGQRIYYVVSHDGQCTIKEIDSMNDEQHNNVFELKSSKCYGLYITMDRYDHFYYFIDDQKTIYKLKRNNDTGKLVEESCFYMKPSERMNNFKIFPFSEFIINDTFLVYQSKIFYLFKSYMQPQGVLDMELLTDKDNEFDQYEKKYVNGMYEIEGSEQFMCVFRIVSDENKQSQDQFVYKMKVYQQPNSERVTMLNVEDQHVKMSTFITLEGKGSKVLVQLNYRYLIFNNAGIFEQSVLFSDTEEERKKNEMKKKLQKGMLQDAVVQENKVLARKSMIHKFKDESTRMLLRDMSGGFKYFIFEDRVKREFKVYKLTVSQGNNYEFEYVRHLDIFNTDTFGHMKEKFDADYFKVSSQFDSDLNGRMEINDDGLAKISLESISDEQILNIRQQDDGEEKVDVLVKWTNLLADGRVNDFYKQIQFKGDSLKNIFRMMNTEEKEIRTNIEIEERYQSRLHKSFKDKTRIKELCRQLCDNASRQFSCRNSEIHNGYLIVYVGRYVKYMNIGSVTNQQGLEEIEVIDADIKLTESMVITSMKSTCQDHIIQIVAMDNQMDILLIVTWDLQKNIEVSMFQVKVLPGQQPEHYSAKGMNQKMNYFINKHRIYDLEYNMPLQISNNTIFSMDYQNKNKCVFEQQVKIFSDSTRYIVMNQGRIMHFPLSRIDLIFWLNVENQEYDCMIEIVRNTNLQKFNKIYNNSSLFHYFADKATIIGILSSMFKESQEGTFVDQSIQNMPLVILNRDCGGMTALERALSFKKPKSFELMLDMLSSFDELCVSKMILKSLQTMLKSESDLIWQFFNTATYRPKLMKEPLSCYWPTDLDELVFSCHTSLISSQFIETVLVDMKFMKENELAQNKLEDSIKIQNLNSGKELMSLKLELDNDESDIVLQRVICEINDFDWIFQQDNPKNMILMLADISNQKFFLSKNIKTFIKLMWQIYQPQIIKLQFIPYMIYMALFLCLASASSICLDEITDDPKDNGVEYDEDFPLGLFRFISILCWVMFCLFFYVEVRQIWAGPRNYFTDYWNYIDLFLHFFSVTFLFFMTEALFSQNSSIASVITLRTWAALTAFMFWLKCFYWMRVFESFAHFVTLITKTVIEIKTFAIMLLLCICAFSNFFFIINRNSQANPKYQPEVKDDERYRYVSEFIPKQHLFNAFFSMYLTGLGEFDSEGYGQGPNKIMAYCFFFLATFLILVVFMNMLIAIMGGTFSTVVDEKEQSQYFENIQMMNDFVWLVDLNDKFFKEKYIVRVVPDVANVGQKEDIIGEMEINTVNITTKIEILQKKMMKRIEQMESNTCTRGQLKGLETKVAQIQLALKDASQTETQKKKDASEAEEKLAKEKKEAEEAEKEEIEAEQAQQEE